MGGVVVVEVEDGAFRELLVRVLFLIAAGAEEFQAVERD